MHHRSFAELAFLALAVGPMLVASPIRWEIADGGNGHWYDAILVPGGVTWTNANNAAQAMGNGWHMATIISAAENQFVFGLVDDLAFWNCCGFSNLVGPISSGPWIGGFRSGGGFAWVTGEPFTFANWGPFEPFGNGDRIVFAGFNVSTSAPQGNRWNDITDAGSGVIPFGYLIETSHDVLQEPVPEPASLWLAAPGLAIALYKRRRGRAIL